MIPRLKSLAAAGVLLAASLSHATTIDLGAAKDYSGFFFGNVHELSDVEGRLAVGGNLINGFDVGYRNVHGSTGPSLLVGGNVTLKNTYGSWGGTIYNGPKSPFNTDGSVIDTNASIGPSSASWVPGNVALGSVVYGGTLTAQNFPQTSPWNPPTQFANAEKKDSSAFFASALTQLNSLSSSLKGSAETGAVAVSASGDLKLTGKGNVDVEVFNLGNLADIKNITLSNVKAGAHIVINSLAKSINLSGFLGGDKAGSTDILAQSRDRLIFNFSDAQSVRVGTFVNGTILATGANFTGNGHVEGHVIGLSTSEKFEIGREPFTPHTSPVPEPETLALMLAGLGAVALVSRRKKLT